MEETAPGSKFPNKLILIVEDDKSIHYFIKSVLAKRGFQTVSAEDGVQALEKVRAHRLHLVLLDIAMPLMDGMETLSRIRAINPRLPVIMLSVWRDKEHLVQTAQYNIFAYFQKPYKVSEVMEKVEQALALPDPNEGVTLPGEGSSAPGGAETARKKDSKKMKAWPIALSFAILLGVGGIFYKFWTPSSKTAEREIPLKFSLPYNNPTAITYDGKSIWISDWTTQLIYKHKPDRELTLEKHFSVSDGIPISIAWGGKVLWLLTQDGSFQELNPLTCEPVAVHKIKNYVPAILSWDGANLWSCDVESKRIAKHKMDASLSIAVSYPYPGKTPTGMAWVGKDLWISDDGTGSIYSFRLENNIFTLIQNYVFDAHRDRANKLSGIMFDGDSIWTVSEGNGQVFRHPLSVAKK